MAGLAGRLVFPPSALVRLWARKKTNYHRRSFRSYAQWGRTGRFGALTLRFTSVPRVGNRCTFYGKSQHRPVRQCRSTLTLWVFSYLCSFPLVLTSLETSFLFLAFPPNSLFYNLGDKSLRCSLLKNTGDHSILRYFPLYLSHIIVC